MNNNSVIINDYLQNRMSREERAVFEARLAADKELQYELEVQQQIIKAAEHAGLKMEFAKVIRRKIVLKKIITGTAIVVICTTFVLLYVFKQTIFPGNTSKNKKEIVNLEQTGQSSFVHPPMESINVPLTEYSFHAEVGDTIFHPSGSIIYFPPSALVDEAGNIVKGKVKITYREFADPIDFFVSGIPMDYDSAGRKYHFESSGMCEINAYRDNRAVFINQSARPQVYLSGKNKSPLHNLYFLDMVARRWKYAAKDIITELKNTVGQIHRSATVSEEHTGLPAKPLKPTMASDDRQAFSIAIDPGSFEELQTYDRLKFEVLDQSNYRRSDADEHWDNVKLERSNTEGVYSITFTNSTRMVSYQVRPVLEGADYTAALKSFNEKNKLYEQALKNRLANEKAASDSSIARSSRMMEKMNAEKAWNDQVNALIVLRNKKMRELRQQLEDEFKKRVLEQSKTMEEQFQLLVKNGDKYAADMNLNDEVLRTFSINNFGIWNCDHPQYPNNEIPISVNYADSFGKSISFYNMYVVYKGFNGITQFPSSTQIRVIPGSENMLWSVMNGYFYYFPYADFAKTAISRATQTFSFKMRKSQQPVSSYQEIRQLVEKL
jgi:hypothetical protein